MSAARIGKIRMKGGGAEVRLISQTPERQQDNLRGLILNHAKKIADMSEPTSELIGFVTIGLFSDGTSSTGCRFDPKTSPIPRALMPRYVAEVLRRDLVTAQEAEEVACDVVNRANGFTE